MSALSTEEHAAVSAALRDFERALTRRLAAARCQRTLSSSQQERIFGERASDDAHLLQLRALAHAADTVDADDVTIAAHRDLIDAYELLARQWGCSGRTAWAAWAQARYQRELQRLPDQGLDDVLEDAYDQAVALAG